MAWLPDDEKILMICLFVLTQLTNVTDRHTDRQTPHDVMGRTCIASRGKNYRIFMKFCTQQQILN